jgi:hypothetical protein
MLPRLDMCPGCGYPHGRQACQDLFNDVALRVRALAWTDSMKTWRLMHDVYDIQHEEDFCGRYRGLAAHLGGVCWAIEFGGAETGYRALQQLIERNPWRDRPYPPAPGIPKARGSITVATLRDLDEPQLLISGVDRWARSAWVAYADLHVIAREWIQQALALPPGRHMHGRGDERRSS